jgi:hypothetical protein
MFLEGPNQSIEVGQFSSEYRNHSSASGASNPSVPPLAERHTMAERRCFGNRYSALIQRFLATMLLTVIPFDPAGSQVVGSKLISFADFIRDVKQADAHEFLTRPNSKVRDLAAFEEMRQYVLTLYRGVCVRHSYVVGSQTVDCVLISQQRSLQGRSSEIAPEPPEPRTPTPPRNSYCEGHTIPMRRITLEQLFHFKTLSAFLAKSPNGSGRAPIPGK